MYENNFSSEDFSTLSRAKEIIRALNNFYKLDFDAFSVTQDISSAQALIDNIIKEQEKGVE